MKVAQEFRNQSQESGWQAKFDKLKGESDYSPRVAESKLNNSAS